ncbi:hypothetical protein HRD49_18150 [Corallococcus exiguus]|uniref:Uncharacterized protein n=1 Tax=Corallococcus exiguus TaxID=83462 RepID=A0A7X4YE48_9BACT|nr:MULTISPECIES: hypothetical protein [Corallococcus]RKI45890.1 hypothetical protein D7Y27_09220 [Corallococcus sp. AB004]NBC43704.1 hypothetical protein [Corallococcus exiguus]NNC14902.1 hypothetical protein [Corallococcus exiguus]NPC71515.1 hypothetical protein [Corallococcus exiguus]NPD25621.1 hypothetical protein [Corallococcus exiguus]
MSNMRVVFTPCPGQGYQADIKKVSQGHVSEVQNVSVWKSLTTDATATFTGGPGDSFFMQLSSSGGPRALSGTATFSSDVTITFGMLYTVFEEG